MTTENNEISIPTHITQKREWFQPTLMELDISETEGGAQVLIELLNSHLSL